MWSQKFLLCALVIIFFLWSHLAEKMGQLNNIEYLHNGNSTNCLQPFIFNLSLPRSYQISVVSLSTRDPYCFPHLIVLHVEHFIF